MHRSPFLRTALAAALVITMGCGPSGVTDDGGGGCQSGQITCLEGCVNPDTNRNHCGGCNNPCASTQVCEDGACVDDSCTETTSEAQSGVLPADIIIAVDNSGSMASEAGFVQDSMNQLVATLVASGIDAHVILISSDSTDSEGICVPAPLGSGACPGDESLPLFRHVATTVSSANSLQLILSTYPQWQSSLRPGATRTVVVVSDDNSALSATNFSQQMVALDPTFTGFKFDAIVAPVDPPTLACFACAPPNCAACHPCCGLDPLGIACIALPAEEGVVYKELVAATSGVLGDLCTQDFLPVFQDIATAVVGDSMVACVYNIPDPPNGEIDYGRVNVEYKPTPTSTAELIPNVPGGLVDCGAAGGWYYDDPASPSQVIFCPTTCAEVQANPNAQVTVKFGCITVVVE